MSDIIGDPVHAIASGPTIPSPPISLQICTDKFPKFVQEVLQTSSSVEISCEENHFIIANNKVALESLRKNLEGEGFKSFIVSMRIDGDAQEFGKYLAKLICAKKNNMEEVLSKYGVQLSNSNRFALLFGGETTVKIGESIGKGGRNQHMVLSVLCELMQFGPPPDRKFTFLSCGTDGQDGPTDAAGAVITDADIDMNSMSFAQEKLKACDSYDFWSKYLNGRCHILTGPTGTNVMDVQMILIEFN